MASRSKPLRGSFRFGVTLRLVFIVATAFGLAFVVMRHTMLFLPLGLSLLLLLLSVGLIRYIEKSTRDLTHFLLSIKQGAFTESYSSSQRGSLHSDLGTAMDDIIREFSRVASEKELHYQYLRTLNETINIGIIAFTSDNKVRSINPAAKAILKQNHIATFSDVASIDKQLALALANAKPEIPMLIKVVIGEELVQLRLVLKEITLQGDHVRILLLQNLHAELEEKELQAWHQIMDVMTHEIMNSITPIVSLSEAAQKILFKGSTEQCTINELSDGNVEDVAESVSTIAQRSKGLLQFVRSYRDYSSGLTPNFKKTDLTLLIERLAKLMRPEMQTNNIRFEVQLPTTSVHAMVDGALIEQAVVNVLKNAMYAVKHREDAHVILSLHVQSGARTSIAVQDNGSGIDAELLPKIFVPFFSTKEKGTGIGLSLTQQIMKLHNGQMRVQTEPGSGTTFTLQLPLA